MKTPNAHPDDVDHRAQVAGAMTALRRLTGFDSVYRAGARLGIARTMIHRVEHADNNPSLRALSAYVARYNAWLRYRLFNIPDVDVTPGMALAGQLATRQRHRPPSHGDRFRLWQVMEHLDAVRVQHHKSVPALFGDRATGDSLLLATLQAYARDVCEPWGGFVAVDVVDRHGMLLSGPDSGRLAEHVPDPPAAGHLTTSTGRGVG